MPFDWLAFAFGIFLLVLFVGGVTSIVLFVFAFKKRGRL